MLLRGLLDMPKRPAILALQVFALAFNSIAVGGDLHNSAGQFYDVPMISLRNAILDDIFADHTLVNDYFAPMKGGADLRHVRSCLEAGLIADRTRGAQAAGRPRNCLHRQSAVRDGPAGLERCRAGGHTGAVHPEGG